jgi:quercetin dioxygenase-like cupin family protein
MEGEHAMHVPKIRLSAAAAALLLMGVAGTALGTPASGVLSAPILARGDFTDPVDVKFKIGTDQGIVVSNAPDAGEVVVQQITIAPGGTTGWHSHPGPVVVVVKAGALTFVEVEQGICTERTYRAGSAFVDQGQGHAHSAFNRGTENLELIATYFDVPVGGSPRIDQPAAAAC